MIIRTFQQGKIHNLFDRRKHSRFVGMLVFEERRGKLVANSQLDEVQKAVSKPQEQDQRPKLDQISSEKGIGEKNSQTKIDNKSREELGENILRFAFWVDGIVFRVIKLCTENGRKIAEKLGIQKSKLKLAINKVVKSEKPDLKIDWAGIHAKSKIVLDNKGLAKKLFGVHARLNYAVVFLLIAFLSLGAIVAPMVFAQFSLPVNNSVIQKIIPTPTPFTYDYYYQPSKDSLYPIREFRIEIPKIKLESSIVDNVDTNIEGEYKDKLQFGVAHAKGSYLPPENGGAVYLFAHSTDTVFNIARYNAKFFSVRELEKGDEIKVFFNNREYDYTVKEKFVINPQEIDVIRNADTDLILQTCWPPGTDWQRLIVLADRKEVSESAESRVN